MKFYLLARAIIEFVHQGLTQTHWSGSIKATEAVSLSHHKPIQNIQHPAKGHCCQSNYFSYDNMKTAD